MLVLEKSLVGFRSQPELAILLDERLDTRVMPEPLPGLRGIRRQAVLVGPSLEKAVGAAPLAVRRLAHELQGEELVAVVGHEEAVGEHALAQAREQFDLSDAEGSGILARPDPVGGISQHAQLANA